MSTLNRAERGKHTLHRHALLSLLNTYSVSESERQALLDLYDTVDERHVDQYGTGLTGAVPTYLVLEQSASAILAYQSEVVPGLLQTEDYAASLHPRIASGEDRKSVVKARLARQEAWHNRKTPLTVILDEAVFVRSVGGESVMRAQVEKLTDDATLPYVNLRVIPFNAGSVEGTFTLLKFHGDPALGYIEHVGGSTLVDNPETLSRLSEAWQQLEEVSVPFKIGGTMAIDLSRAMWKKSTHSRNTLDRAECVEVAGNLADVVAIRDSKRVTGPALLVSRESFAASVRTLKARQR